MADRGSFVHDGVSAVTWFEVAPGSSPLWSPDGTALLVTSNIKSDGRVRFIVHRVDAVTGFVTDTNLPAGTIGGQAGWAADSRRYVVLLAGSSTDNGFVPGPLQYVDVDGHLGPKVDISGGLVGGGEAYSPSGRYMLLDTTYLMASDVTCSKVVDVASGAVVSTMLPGERPVGWYDDDTYVRLDPYKTKLQLVGVTSGSVIREIPLGGAATAFTVQLGSSSQLAGPAAGLGF